MRFDTFISQENVGNFDGGIEYENGELILFRKSALIRAAFGAIGNALANGKEYQRVPVAQIRSMEIERGTFSSQVTLILPDGTFLRFKHKSDMDAAFIPMLKQKIGTGQPEAKAIPAPAAKEIPKAIPMAAVETGAQRLGAQFPRVPADVLNGCWSLCGNRAKLSDYLFAALKAGKLSIEDANRLMEQLAPSK